MSDPRDYHAKRLMAAGFTEGDLKKIRAIRDLKTATGAAHRLRSILASVAKRWGLDPDIEISPVRSAQEQARYTIAAPAVIWESGPFEWGYEMSMLLFGATHWHCEPYWSFDVHFCSN